MHMRVRSIRQKHRCTSMWTRQITINRTSKGHHTLLPRPVGSDNFYALTESLRRRPGSAPPQVDELSGSPVGSHDLTRLLMGQNVAGNQSPRMFSSSVQASEHDYQATANSASEEGYGGPEYHYANTKINPRLPPPITSRDLGRASSPWSDLDSCQQVCSALQSALLIIHVTSCSK